MTEKNTPATAPADTSAGGRSLRMAWLRASFIWALVATLVGAAVDVRLRKTAFYEAHARVQALVALAVLSCLALTLVLGLLEVRKALAIQKSSRTGYYSPMFREGVTARLSIVGLILTAVIGVIGLGLLSSLTSAAMLLAGVTPPEVAFGSSFLILLGAILLIFARMEPLVRAQFGSDWLAPDIGSGDDAAGCLLALGAFLVLIILVGVLPARVTGAMLLLGGIALAVVGAV